MKQRITVEQIMELSEDQLSILNLFWNPQRGDIFATEWLNDNDCVVMQEMGIVLKTFHKKGLDLIDNGGDINWNKKVCYPLLTIGQQIEMLSSINPWGLGNVLGDIILPDIIVYDEGREIELCDALWRELKDSLKNQSEEETNEN